MCRTKKVACKTSSGIDFLFYIYLHTQINTFFSLHLLIVFYVALITRFDNYENATLHSGLAETASKQTILQFRFLAIVKCS